MRDVELRLAVWHNLYKAIQVARERRGAGKSKSERDVLDQELRGLQEQADEALDSVNTALATKSPTSPKLARPAQGQ